ncbi:Protein ltv1 [Blastocladiella emersonii ATCC 22665]|nr:Protein ltv1 [Blastocladiella emersonii ATCC 22665]
MGKKKPFINKREARHYQVVHRSQRDAAIHSEEASPYVLKPVLASPNLNKIFKKNPDAIPNPYEVDADLVDVMEPRDLDSEGEYYSDEYYSDEDYSDEDGEEGEEPRAAGVFDDVEGEEDDEEAGPSSRKAAARVSAPPADADVDAETKAGKAALFGIYYDDREYDYLKHLKPMGQAGAVFVAAADPDAKKKGRSTGGIQFHDDTPATGGDLPAEALASANELPRNVVGMASHDDGMGLGLDLPEEVREVMYALEDDAYVEDDDRYFEALALDELDGDLGDLLELVGDAERAKADADKLPEVLDWTMAAKIKHLQVADDAGSDVGSDGAAGGRSDDEGGEEYDYGENDETVPEEIRALRRRARELGLKRKEDEDDTLSMSSMSSSILSRTSHLEILDERFDMVELQYADEELGAVDVAPPPAYNAEQKEYMNALLDEFLTKTAVTTHNTPYENLKAQGGGVGQYEIVRRMMRTDEDGNPLPPIDLAKYAYSEVKDAPDSDDDRDLPQPFIIEDKYENEKWDCESILSTYSNLDNHPTVISERGRRRRKREAEAAKAAAAAAAAAGGEGEESEAKPAVAVAAQTMDRSAPTIALDPKTGLPVFSSPSLRCRGNEASDDDESSDEEELVEVVNLGTARPKYEDKDEKRQRKQALKEAKRERRTAKKDLKQAFKEEGAKQVKIAITRKNQAKTVLL